jgi:sialate O-acetylesterase
MMNYLKILLILILCVVFTGSDARVTLPNLFTNHMVLQRGIKIPVWGRASSGERITVTLGSNVAVTTTNANGKWMVKLKPMKSGGPYTLKVKGEDTLEFSDVLLGDVWICAGQSNMELPVRRSTSSKNEIANSANPQIRLLTIDHQANADSTRENVNGVWFECNPATVEGFSAVGYYFGRKLEMELNVPIGLIDIGWNATRIEAWTSRDALKRLESGKIEVAAYERSAPQDDLNAMKNYEEKLKEYKDAFSKGNTTIEAPERPRPARKVPSSVGSLYNYMISPLIPYGIKGAIWYQGEANAKSAENAIEYRKQLPNMIKNWRDDWGQGSFPFIFVQLPNFQSTGFWPLMRESMLKTYLADKKTGMAVTIDIGHKTDIHPSNKQDVGYRLALQALNIAYKKKNIVSQGPVFKSMIIKNREVTLSFDHSGSGLKTKQNELKGFKIAGSDQQFYDATATILKDRVIVSSDKVSSPVAVRYGWEDYPDCSLYNMENLPASPFRTDSWIN